MKLRRWSCAVLVFVSFAAVDHGQEKQTEEKQPVLAIKAGKLVDPETGKTAANQIILVQGKTIKEIGPSVAIPADAQVIDLSKSTVLPGLFDAHTHLCMSV